MATGVEVDLEGDDALLVGVGGYGADAGEAAVGVDFEGVDLAGAAQLDVQECSAAGGGQVDRARAN